VVAVVVVGIAVATAVAATPGAVACKSCSSLNQTRLDSPTWLGAILK
jgi:hypothetical protein